MFHGVLKKYCAEECEKLLRVIHYMITELQMFNMLLKVQYYKASTVPGRENLQDSTVPYSSVGYYLDFYDHSDN